MKKNNTYKISYILLGVLIVTQFYSLVKINSLESQVENYRHMLYSTEDDLSRKINSIYDNVDQRLKEDESLLNKAWLELGTIDTEALTVPIRFTIEPKIIEDDTSIYLDFDGEKIELERKGLEFTASKDFIITDRVDPKIVIQSNGVKKIEENENLKLSSLRNEIFPYIHARFSGKSSYIGDSYRMDGDLDVDYKLSNQNNPFIELVYVVKVDGKTIKESPLSQDERKASNFNKLKIEDNYPLEDGQILTLNIVALDSLGFSHEYLFTSFEAGSNMQREPYLEKLSIKAPNGENVYMFDEMN